MSWSDTLLWRRAHSIPLVWTIISFYNHIQFSNNYVILGKIFYSANLIARYIIVNYLWYSLMTQFLMMTSEYFRVLISSHQYWVSPLIVLECTVIICFKNVENKLDCDKPLVCDQPITQNCTLQEKVFKLFAQVECGNCICRSTWLMAWVQMAHIHSKDILKSVPAFMLPATWFKKQLNKKLITVIYSCNSGQF